jgi:predicted MFS family arabinose efflux permease
MEKEKKKSVFDEDLDSEYIGNVFGWKISIIGLVVIAGFIVLYMFMKERNKNLPHNINNETQIAADSISAIHQNDTLEIK